MLSGPDPTEPTTSTGKPRLGPNRSCWLGRQVICNSPGCPFSQLLDVQWCSPHIEPAFSGVSGPTSAVSVLNLSAPEILHRPAPQPGAPLFWRPPPRAPANPARPIFAPRSRPQASAARLGRGGCRPRGGPQGACESPRRVPCLTPKLEASTASTVGATRTGGAVGGGRAPCLTVKLEVSA